MADRTRGGWLVTTVAAFAAVAGMVLAVLGLLIGRPDLVVVGAPLILSMVWGIAIPPRAMPGVSLGIPRPVVEYSEVEAPLSIDPAEGVPATRIRVSAESHRSVEALVDTREPRKLRVSLVTVRTGRRKMFRIDFVGISSNTVFRSEPQTVGPVSIILLPQAVGLREVPIPFQLHGLTGAHGSRRSGEGGDLRDVAVFAPGDRLRRIDWKTTARRQVAGAHPELYVRRNFATADAHVMLVVDPRDNVGPKVNSWNTGEISPLDATALDIARRAAATLARHYLQQGDRVGLVDMTRGGRTLLPASGRRHHHRLVHHLAIAESDGESRRYIRAPQIPSGAMVVVFSTFLDDIYAEMARMWRHEGHRVVAIDVLPTLNVEGLSPHAGIALRMLWMERTDRLADLIASGVEVVRWVGDTAHGDPVGVLTALSRSQRRRR